MKYSPYLNSQLAHKNDPSLPLICHLNVQGEPGTTKEKIMLQVFAIYSSTYKTHPVFSKILDEHLRSTNKDPYNIRVELKRMGYHGKKSGDDFRDGFTAEGVSHQIQIHI